MICLRCQVSQFYSKLPMELSHHFLHKNMKDLLIKTKIENYLGSEERENISHI